MNRNLGWALASIISIGSFGNAMAADMAVKAPPPPLVEPGFNWTGFYVGLNVGGDWGRSRTNSPIANTPGCAPCYIPSVIADINAQQFQTINGSGFTGGAQAGYNYQVNRLVLGVEADINAFSGTTTTSAFFTGFPGGAGSIPPTYTNSVSTNWLFTGRGRVGFTANNWLFYGTGGVAVTDLSYKHTFVSARCFSTGYRQRQCVHTLGGFDCQHRSGRRQLSLWRSGRRQVLISSEVSKTQSPGQFSGLFW